MCSCSAFCSMVEVNIVGTSNRLIRFYSKWTAWLQLGSFMQNKEVYLSRKLAQPEGAQQDHRHVCFSLQCSTPWLLNTQFEICPYAMLFITYMVKMQGRYLARRLAAPDCFSDDQKPEVAPPNQHAEPADVEQLKGLVTEAYHELEDLYAWLRKKGVSKYSIAGSGRPGSSPRPRRPATKKDHLGPAKVQL